MPETNPFVSVPGVKPEIWSYGHRNPQGLTVDPGSGVVWATEHGPQGGDELNLIQAGRNYGWPLVSHGRNYDGSPVASGETSAPGVEPPAYVWTPAIAPSGLTVRREVRRLPYGSARSQARGWFNSKFWPTESCVSVTSWRTSSGEYATCGSARMDICMLSRTIPKGHCSG